VVGTVRMQADGVAPASAQMAQSLAVFRVG